MGCIPRAASDPNAVSFLSLIIQERQKSRTYVNRDFSNTYAKPNLASAQVLPISHSRLSLGKKARSSIHCV